MSQGDTVIPLLIEVLRTYAPVLVPGAIVVSALIGALIALISVRHHREVARKRATLDVILRSEGGEFRTITETFQRISDSPEGLLAILNPDTDPRPESDDYYEVQAYLNHYELVAIGIKQGIIDATFYKAWMKTNLVADWNTSRPLISEVRNNWKAAFRNWEELAVSWGGEPLENSN